MCCLIVAAKKNLSYGDGDHGAFLEFTNPYGDVSHIPTLPASATEVFAFALLPRIDEASECPTFHLPVR